MRAAAPSGAFSLPPEFKSRIAEVVDAPLDPVHDSTKYLGRVDAILRAVAHPVRRAMLTVLSSETDELSAYQLAKAVGFADCRRRDAMYQVRYLRKSGCIERARLVPPARGARLVALYRLRHDYAPLLAAITDLESGVNKAPEQVEPAPLKSPRTEVASPERCSCPTSAPDSDGYCFNCTKPVGKRVAA
jgi:hypothetical protein